MPDTTLTQQQTQTSLLKLLGPYKVQLDSLLQAEVDQLGDKSVLRDACEYALLGGGKRFRPALVLMMAEAIGKGYDVRPAALAVEYHHTASLIADDLPCMDDDKMRRGRPTAHLAFGEDTALLASFALIAAGYEQLSHNALLLPERGDEICRLALLNISRNTGINGLTGGQHYDLHPPLLTEEILYRTIALKTGALFEVSLVLGWLFGGGDLEKLDQIKRLAHHLGIAFQMVDDFDDLEQDRLHEAPFNSVLFLGEDEVRARLRAELASLRQCVATLDLGPSPLDHIADLFTI